MKRFFSIERALVVVVLVVGIRTWAQEAATANHQIWKTDLRQFGYQRFSSQSVRFMRLAVDFGDDQHVAVAWISPDATKLSERKGPKLGDPAHLHVVVLDARTGRKQSQKDWSAGYSGLPLLLGIPNGQFLICIGNSLRSITPALDLVRDRELPNRGICLSTIAQLSPSRRAFLLSVRGEQIHKELLNVETLATLSTWTEPRGAYSDQAIAFSDNWIAGYCGEPREICLRRSSQEEWRPLRSEDLDTRMAKGWRVPVRFLSDEILAITQKDATTVTTVRGGVLFQIKSPKDRFLFAPIASAEGERFAVIEYQFRGLRSEPFDMYPFQTDDRVLVYGIKDRRAIFSLKLNGTSPWTPWDTHVNSVALPPSGVTIAILSDTLLTVYALPEDATTRH